MKTKKIRRFKVVLVNGLNQNPVDHDFHITPCLTYGSSDRMEEGYAKGIGIEWGHWAIVFGIYTLIKKQES